MVKIIGHYHVPENSDVSLIELLVLSNPGEFDISDFTQELSGTHRSSWQAPFGEVYLDLDGTHVIGDSFNIPGGNSKSTRLLFFIYFLDPAKPLTTPFGKVELPPITIQPIRVRTIVRFEDPE